MNYYYLRILIYIYLNHYEYILLNNIKSDSYVRTSVLELKSIPNIFMKIIIIMIL